MPVETTRHFLACSVAWEEFSELPEATKSCLGTVLCGAWQGSEHVVQLTIPAVLVSMMIFVWAFCSCTSSAKALLKRSRIKTYSRHLWVRIYGLNKSRTVLVTKTSPYGLG